MSSAAVEIGALRVKSHILYTCVLEDHLEKKTNLKQFLLLTAKVPEKMRKTIMVTIGGGIHLLHKVCWRLFISLLVSNVL